MSTFHYRYLDPLNADEYVSMSDHWVWYFTPDQVKPPRCTNLKDRPTNAESAVVASPDPKFAAGDKMGLVTFAGGKDPIPPPPPPPPPWHASLVAYLKQQPVVDFFNGVPRSTEA